MMRMEEIKYDSRYFEAMENRFWSGAHGQRVRDIAGMMQDFGITDVNSRVLDYGGGSGAFSMFCAGEYWLWEPSEAGRTYAAKHYTKATILREGERPAIQFDGILLLDVIEHVREDVQEDLLQRILGAQLAEHGILIVSTDNHGSRFLHGFGKFCQRVDRLLSAEGRTYRWLKRIESRNPHHVRYQDTHIGLRTYSSLTALFANAGYQVLAERHGFFYRSPLSGIVAWLTGWRPLHSVYALSVCKD